MIKNLFHSYFTSRNIHKNLPDDYFEKLERPRILKTHLPIQLLPLEIWTKKPKIIFICRDVKDVAVSCFYLRKTYYREHMENIEDHFEDFLNDRIHYAPYKDYVRNFETLRGEPNYLFLTYEAVTSDRESAIRKVANFLEKEIDEKNVKKLVEHLDFKAMKSKCSIIICLNFIELLMNIFFRKYRPQPKEIFRRIEYEDGAK